MARIITLVTYTNQPCPNGKFYGSIASGEHIGSIRKLVKTDEPIHWEYKWEYQGEVFRFKKLEQGLKVEIDLLESDETYESVSRALATPPPDISPGVPANFGLPLA